MNKISFNDTWICYRSGHPEEGFPTDVPHDAMLLDGKSETSPGGVNTGWYDAQDYTYEKNFFVPAEWNGKDLILEFEGVYRKATVLVNGQKAAYHDYGYTGFYIDISKFVSYGEENHLKVEVVNSDQPNSRWHSGTGIYRPVWLYILPMKHIKMDGNRVTTLDYKTRSISVSVETEGDGDLLFEVFDQDRVIAEMLGGKSNVIIVLIYIIVYAAAYVFVARKLPEGDGIVVSKKSLFPMATIIMLVLVLSIMDDSFIAGFEAGSLHRVIYRIIDALCCFYVLRVQISQKELMKLQNELSGINAAWRLQKEQYEMTGDTIENINRKCHDLKHQIRALRNMADGQEREEYLDELENDIMIYDTALQTGNRALDIVLMEKALFCKNHGINWTCMADGARLDFMKVEDIYAIFGNALDNAIRAVMELEDAMKRVISVKIVIQNSILMIQIQNYYKGSLHFENGLPLTTKKNKRDHGYGMKSIQHTAEKYDGTITVSTENTIFMLQILIPVAEAKSA